MILLKKKLELKIFQNYTYPTVNINLQQRELDDAPDVMRVKDYEVGEKRYYEPKGKDLVHYLQNWK